MASLPAPLPPDAPVRATLRHSDPIAATRRPTRAGATPTKVDHPTARHLERWVRQGDEAILLDLLRRHPSALHGADQEATRDWCYQRALRDAAVDGVCWTPLLDALERTGVWPRAAIERDLWNLRGGFRWAIADGAWDGPLAPRQEPIELLAPLATWLATTEDPRIAEALLDAFAAPSVWEVVAAHAPVLDRALVQALLRRPTLLPRLVANPALTPVLADGLVWWVTAALAGAPALTEAPADSLRADGLTPEGRVAVRPLATDVAASLAARSRPSPALQQALVDRLLPSDTGATTGAAAFACLVLLAPDTPLTSATRATLADRLSPSDLVTLVRHPSATPEDWARLAAFIDHEPVRTALLERAEARQTPAVRAALTAWCVSHERKVGFVVQVRAALAREATPAEFSDHWTAIAGSPFLALDVLEQGAPTALAALTSTNFATWLASIENPVLRRRALTVAARLPLDGVPDGGVRWFAGPGAALVRAFVATQPAEALALFEAAPAAAAGLVRVDLRPLLLPPMPGPLRLRAHVVVAMLPDTPPVAGSPVPSGAPVAGLPGRHP